MSGSYRPAPLANAQLALPDALQPLLERLAENVHDVWAAGRLADGWRYGPQRDDARKTHPGLVPYGELDESEKEYDRRTAEATLKAILELGYRIEAPRP